MKQQSNNQWESLYEMARVIANSKSNGRCYREDIISEAYLAVASGAESRSEIENASESHCAMSGGTRTCTLPWRSLTASCVTEHPRGRVPGQMTMRRR